MMDFWNIAVTSLTFAAPLAAILFFAMKGKAGGPDSESKASLALFGLMFFAAAIGAFRFEHPVRIEFLWPLTVEPSGYFEFSLQLLWLRFSWILFSAAVFLGFAAFDGPGSFVGDRRPLRFLFLVGAFLFSVLAFLSENAMLSLMFAEITVFLMHAFGVGLGGDEGELERVSYFKRSCFLFLSLVTLLGIAATRMFTTNSIVLLGAVLYIISLVFSRHNFIDWKYLPLTLVQLGTALFLLGQVTHEDITAELAMPLTVVFGLAVLAFSAFSFLAAQALSSAFWMALTLLAYVLFLRFGSTKPSDSFWGTYEAVTLGTAFAIGTCLRFGSRFDLLWKRVLVFLLVSVLLAVISGALPGVESSAMKFEGDVALARAAILGLLTFFVAAASGKALALSFQEPAAKGTAGGAFASSLVPALIVLAIQFGALFRFSEINGESILGLDPLAVVYDLRVLMSAAGVVFGLGTGAILGSHSGFVVWTRNRGRKMEDIFPPVDPAIVEWNQNLVHGPERGLEWISGRLQFVTSQGAEFLEKMDRGVFGEKFFRGFSEYGSSLSLFVRFFHSGNVRMYMFLGVMISLFASFLFLLEGK
jgi:hypothetical protein